MQRISPFEDWWYGVEGVRLRSECAYDDVLPSRVNEFKDWVRRAFNAGAEFSEENKPRQSPIGEFLSEQSGGGK